MTVLVPASEGIYPETESLNAAVRRLAVGILRRAFLDLVPSSREPKMWQRDALKWFFSDDTHPGSLHWVCAILEMDRWIFRAYASKRVTIYLHENQ